MARQSILIHLSRTEHRVIEANVDLDAWHGGPLVGVTEIGSKHRVRFRPSVRICIGLMVAGGRNRDMYDLESIRICLKTRNL
jgi:hypothetical protein